jgi:hypothetical protein
MTTGFQKIHTSLLNQMHHVMRTGTKEVNTFPRAYFSEVCQIIGGFTYLCMATDLNVTIRTEGNDCIVEMVKE